jgi:hypothetical protein
LAHGKPRASPRRVSRPVPAVHRSVPCCGPCRLSTGVTASMTCCRTSDNCLLVVGPPAVPGGEVAACAAVHCSSRRCGRPARHRSTMSVHWGGLADVRQLVADERGRRRHRCLVTVAPAVWIAVAGDARRQVGG